MNRPSLQAAEPGLLPQEAHLRNLRQLTFGGENAEAYWSFDGRRLSLQATVPTQDQCDQIYTLDVTGAVAGLQRVGSSAGRATCSFFSPTGDRLIFSSTRAASLACPAPPDRSRGYVWPLYPYQIYTARPDGGDVRRLTQGDHYEAEATVCRDGSVVFTSDRDGDLELYRMRLDGSGVTRLTSAPGYDGGAFFSDDCKRIVWRAARPRDDREAAEMKELLRQRLVRPSRMELWVANADGSEAHAVTDLGAASFAPFYLPRAAAPRAQGSGRRVIFSSNHGDPRGREFDLWAVDESGTNLERITHAPEFDGFPMFSPDGRRLVFASNRGGKVHGETNIFTADWVPDLPADAAPRARTRIDDIADQVSWLADPAREGRGVGSAGLRAAGDRIAGWMKDAGLQPGVVSSKGPPGFFQEVSVIVGVRDAGSRFVLAVPGRSGPATGQAALGPAPMASGGSFRGPLRFVGYGISAPELGWDDLKGMEPLKGQVAVALRGTPPGRLSGKAERSYSDLRYKAWNLREHGALAVVFVDPERDEVPPLKLDGPEGEAGLPVAFAARGVVRGLLEAPLPAAGGELAVLKEAAAAGQATKVILRGVLSGEVRLTREVRRERNVVGLLPGGGAGPRRAVVLGAHYDHLGLGGRGSFVPDQRVIHPGADDNASGVAALLSAAARLATPGKEPEALARAVDLYFVAFTGEEVGLVGSSRFVERLTQDLRLGAEGRPPQIAAMINFDMVGRLHGGPPSAAVKAATQPSLIVEGTDTALEWAELVTPECARAGLRCSLGGDGYGPSDMTPFYGHGVPVLFFFTGAHADYHRPADTADRVNPAGIAQISGVAAAVVESLAQRLLKLPALSYQRPQGPAPRRGDGDGRSYGAYLGTIPDYSAMQGQSGGVKLSGVRPGSPAAQAGVQPGDVLVGILIGAAEPVRRVDNLEDMAFLLRTLKPGQAIELHVLRGGQLQRMKALVGQRPGAAR